MRIRIRYLDGPAAETLREYRAFHLALPSLLWQDEETGDSAVYRRCAEQPDAQTGAWIYTTRSGDVPGASTPQASDQRTVQRD